MIKKCLNSPKRNLLQKMKFQYLFFHLILSFSLFSKTDDISSKIKKNVSEKNIAYINVSVATAWSKPNITRPVDKPSTLNPVGIKQWINQMSLSQKQQLSAEGMLETQALYGNKVIVLSRENQWVNVAVVGQFTPKSTLGYEGWMPASQLVYNEKYVQKLKNKPFVLVTAPTTYLYASSKVKNKTIEISYNTRLPLLKEKKDMYQVLTPNGEKAYIKKKHARVFTSQKSIPKPTGEEIVEEAKHFLGKPYLWSGTSGFGFDCSGFVFAIYNAHGITIARDASAQFLQGDSVEEQNLKPGDLIFLHNEKKTRIVHVGIYAGNSMMIHAPSSDKTIEITHLIDIKKNYAGARRYL